MNLLHHLASLAAPALGPDAAALDTPIARVASRPEFGDYQIDGAMSAARLLRRSPRDIASEVATAVTHGPFASASVAGPGFVNVRVDDRYLADRVQTIASSTRAGVPHDERTETIVVDFSGPNVAKRMHVGHLRSTNIGDTLVRMLRFAGHNVIGDNHVGDWGTQFGMLLYGFQHRLDREAYTEDPIGELERVYRLLRQEMTDDPDVANACRQELVHLQAGCMERRGIWDELVAISNAEAERIYRRLSVTFDEWLGESAYNDLLPGVVEDLVARGVAKESDGAVVVFFEGALAETPYLVRKADGGYLYSTTDIATIGYRVERWSPDRIIYVVDVRQSLHFEQLFEVARLQGHTDLELQHVGFGMMMGPGGTPFKTRDGGTPRLDTLLDQASERVVPRLRARWPEMSEDRVAELAEKIGVAAIRFADVSNDVARDYVFDFERMTAFDGNTGPYLQYGLVRLRSLLAEAGSSDNSAPDPAHWASEDRQLALQVVRLPEALAEATGRLKPHVLCEYLFETVRSFNRLYAEHRVLDAADDERAARLPVLRACERVLSVGLQLLNLPEVDRM